MSAIPSHRQALPLQPALAYLSRPSWKRAISEVDALSGAYEAIGGRGAPFQYERVFIQRPFDEMLSYLDRRMGRGRMWY